MSKTVNKRPSFGALFNADLETVRRYFDVAGHECWVDLKPVDVVAVGAMQSLSPVEATMHLISRTVVDWCLWMKGGEARSPEDQSGRQWQEVRAPENPAQRPQWILDHFTLTLDFGSWLAEECRLINGMGDDQEKN